jgi:hypothetical protein
MSIGIGDMLVGLLAGAYDPLHPLRQRHAHAMNVLLAVCIARLPHYIATIRRNALTEYVRCFIGREVHIGPSNFRGFT